MEKYRKRECEQGTFGDIERDRDELESAKRRLNRLIALNAELDSAVTDARGAVAASLSRPAGYESSFSNLGLWMGILPPAAFFLKIASDAPSDDLGALFLVTVLVCSAAAAAGYFTGKIVGKIVRELNEFSWPARLAMLPFVGITWGILAGGAGGAIIFLFGAIPGAVIGAAAGFVALPAFALLHSALRRGEFIERKHLYPTAIGVAATLAAMILGYPV